MSTWAVFVVLAAAVTSGAVVQDPVGLVVCGVLALVVRSALG